MELTEEIQRDPGRFLKNVDMTKVKTKEDLINELSSQTTKDSRGRDWSKSVDRVIDRADTLFNTHDIQNEIFNNIKQEISSMEPEDIPSYEIPSGIQNENQLKAQLESKRAFGVRKALRNRDAEMAAKIKEEPLDDYEKATAILGFRPAVSTLIAMRERGEL